MPYGFAKWHAIEEIEHKGVAFTTPSSPPPRIFPPIKRWKFRNLVMLNISYTFLRDRVRAMRQFAETRRHSGPRFMAAHFLVPAHLSRIAAADFPGLVVLLPGRNLHPWQHDDREHYRRARSREWACRHLTRTRWSA